MLDNHNADDADDADDVYSAEWVSLYSILNLILYGYLTLNYSQR